MSLFWHTFPLHLGFFSTGSQNANPTALGHSWTLIFHVGLRPRRPFIPSTSFSSTMFWKNACRWSFCVQLKNANGTWGRWFWVGLPIGRPGRLASSLDVSRTPQSSAKWLERDLVAPSSRERDSLGFKAKPKRFSQVSFCLDLWWGSYSQGTPDVYDAPGLYKAPSCLAIVGRWSAELLNGFQPEPAKSVSSKFVEAKLQSRNLWSKRWTLEKSAHVVVQDMSALWISTLLGRLWEEASEAKCLHRSWNSSPA